MGYNKNESIKSTAASQLGAYVSRNEALASNAAKEGMDLFRQAAEKYANKTISTKQGNLFEYIEAAKFNVDASKKLSNLSAEVTDSIGLPHDRADILIKEGNKVVKQIQAKSSKDGISALKELFKKRNIYRDLNKISNPENIDKIKELSEKRALKGSIYSEDYKNLNETIESSTRYDNVDSGGTSYKEVLDAAENPKKYANAFELRQYKSEVLKTTKNAAIAGSIVGGAISLVKNGTKVMNSELEIKDAAKNVMKDTIKTGARSGVTGALGSTIRVTAKKAGINSLAKSNVATSLASGVINVGVTVYNFAKGEIDEQEAMVQIGQNGFSTMSSIYSGMLAGLAFGPAGGAIGSIVGYIMATNVYQSCMAIMKEADLAKEEAKRIKLLSKEARKAMKQQRKEFQRKLKYELDIRDKYYKSCFTAIDEGIKNGDYEKAVLALTDLSLLFKKQLRLSDYNEFCEFMKNSNEPLKL